MGIHQITPHLVIKGAAEAIDFYKTAFGAVENARMSAPDGKGLWHADITIGESRILIADEFLEMGGDPAPATLNGTTVSLNIQVDDCDAVFNQAVAAGCTVKMPPMDMFWGDRYAKLVDPFGHSWAIAQCIEELTFDQMIERGREFAEKMASEQAPA